MISIYLTPDFTQVVKAKENKKNISLSFCEMFPPYWQAVINKDKEELTLLFKKINQYSSLKYEKIYIVLPDAIFAMVQCFEFTSDEGLRRSMLSSLPKPESDYYITVPIKTTPVATTMKTVYALEKEYADVIIAAAKECKFEISSIEASSLAFFRASGMGRLDMSLIEIFNDCATIVTYSPVGGIFRYESPNLAYNDLKNYRDMADRIFSNEFLQHIELVERTFQSSRNDSEFVILARESEQKWIYGIDAVKQRAVKTDLILPKCVTNKLFPGSCPEIMSVVGTFLQEYDLTQDSFYNDPELKFPPFISFERGNLLPKDIQQEVKNSYWIHTAVKTGQVLSSIFCLIINIFSGAIWYFSNITVPDELNAMHSKLQKEAASYKKEIETCKKAKDNEQDVIGAYAKVLNAVPADCSFTEIKIGSENVTKAESNWITIKAVSKNEISFQNFLGSLTNEKSFISPSVSNIAAEDSGLKTADIIIGNKPAKAKGTKNKPDNGEQKKTK